MRLFPLACLAALFFLLLSQHADCLTMDEDTIVGESNNTVAPVTAPPVQQKNEQQGSSWQFGVTAGFSSLDWIHHDSYYDKSLTYSFQPGGSIGVIFRTQSHGKFDFEGGVEFAFLGMRRNFDHSGTYPAYDSVTGDSIGTDYYRSWGHFGYTVPCVFIPLHVLLNLDYGKSGTALIFGPAFGYLLHGYYNDAYSDNWSGTDGAGSSINNGKEDFSKYLNRFLLQMQAGITQSFTIGRFPCFIDAQYSLGILNIYNDRYWAEKIYPTEIRLGFGAFLTR